MREPEPKPSGTWDFYGACAPDETEGGYPGQETFTLGVFQWERKAGSKTKTKKGKVQFRIMGRCNSPATAFAAARAECDKRNAVAD